MGLDTDTIVARHVAHLERRNLARSTIYQRRRALARLGDLDLLAVDTDDLIDALAHLDKPQSRRTEIMHWAGFYGWAYREGLIERDPTIALERPKVPRRLPRPMPDEDKHRALAYAPDKIRPMLYLAAYAGLRACSIAPLRAEDVSFTDRLLCNVYVKGGHHRNVPMSTTLANALANCALPTHGWLFPMVTDPARHFQPWRISSECNRYLHSLGIDHTLHTLRHWFGTQYLKAVQGNLRKTQEAMGHASPATTAIYTLVTQDEIAEGMELLPA